MHVKKRWKRFLIFAIVLFAFAVYDNFKVVKVSQKQLKVPYAPPPLPEYGEIEVALIFSGAAYTRGFCIGGMYEELRKAGIKSDIIIASGSSIGGGAPFAQSYDAPIEEI